MLDFPPYWSLVRYSGIFLATGPLLLFLAFYYIVRGLRKKSFSRSRLGTIAGILLIGTVHFIAAFRPVWIAHQFRSSTQPVTAMSIQRVIESESSNGFETVGRALTIRDSALVQEGLSLLSTARNFPSRCQGPFAEGYRIRLAHGASARFSDHFLSLYMLSNHCDGLAVVIPHFGKGNPGLHNAGKYSSPEFHDWFNEIVRPRLSGEDITEGIRNGTRNYISEA